MKYHYEDENTKIIILIISKDNIIARANLSLKLNESSFITIKGFVIWKSKWLHPKFQEQINITPPRLFLYGKYSDIVYFENEREWYSIEEKIYSAFLKARIERDKKIIKNEDINPEEIPI